MCKEEVHLLLEQILSSLDVIVGRSGCIDSAQAFNLTPDGKMRLDSICMLLVTIGEAIKNIDRYTQKSLLVQYPEINWRNVMGLRDIIVHQYFNVDEEVIFQIVKKNIPELATVIRRIIFDLEQPR